MILLGVATCVSAALLYTDRTHATPASFPIRFGRLTNLSDGKPRLKRFVAGMVVGAGMLTVVLGVVLLAGCLQVGPSIGPPPRMVARQAGLLFTFLLVAFAEEFAFRGYALCALVEAIGFWPATFLTSFLFGLGHYFEGDPFNGATGVFEGAIFECMAIKATGSLAFSIGAHFAWDFSESAI